MFAELFNQCHLNWFELHKLNQVDAKWRRPQRLIR